MDKIITKIIHETRTEGREMSKIKSINEYSVSLLEISQLINPQHGSRGDATLKNTRSKKNSVAQLDDVAGNNIERVRVKLLEGKKISQAEVNLIKQAFSSWYEERKRNNTMARIVFNIISGVFTVGFFQLGFLIAKYFNKSLPTDPSQEIFKVFPSYKAMLKVERFLKQTKGFKVNVTTQSFSTVSQALNTPNMPNMSNFPMDRAELDNILGGNSEEQTSDDTEEFEEVDRVGPSEPNYEDSDLQASFEFNNFL